jgi:hypothetical protein
VPRYKCPMSAPIDVPLRCACGSVRGRALHLSPSRVNRVVCHCSYCVRWAELLARADEVLDEHGGSDVFQMSPRFLRIDEGLQHVACARLTPSGARRWYAACCATPIANTLATPRLPFVGVFPACLELPASRTEVLGPVRARVNGDFPPEQIRALKAGRGALLLMLLRLNWRFWGWWLRGDQRTLQLFDPKTRQPIATPLLVDREATALPPPAAESSAPDSA